MSPITKGQRAKIIKTSLYVVMSAAIAQIGAIATNTPEFFGVYLPFVNIALVIVKQLFTEDKKA